MILDRFSMDYIGDIRNTALLDIDWGSTHERIQIITNADYSDSLDEVQWENFYTFSDCSIENWLALLDVTDMMFTITVLYKQKEDNRFIKKEKMFDILLVTVINKNITEIKTSNSEVIYRFGDDCIGNFNVGWAGKVYDYYTELISEEARRYVQGWIDSSDIWEAINIEY